MKNYASFVAVCFDQDQICVKLLSILKDLGAFEDCDRPAPEMAGGSCTLREFAFQRSDKSKSCILSAPASRAIGNRPIMNLSQRRAADPSKSIIPAQAEC